MKQFRVVIVLAALFILTHCEKEKAFTIDVSGITPTDAMGNAMGPADNSDWSEDATWSETELALFRSDPIDMSGAEQGTVVMKSAYPNPCQQLVNLVFTVSAPAYLKIAIVDQQCNKLASYSFLTNQGLNVYSIPVPNPPFTANRNYRIYYTFNAPGYEMFFKGHGDVAVK